MILANCIWFHNRKTWKTFHFNLGLRDMFHRPGEVSDQSRGPQISNIVVYAVREGRIFRIFGTGHFQTLARHLFPGLFLPQKLPLGAPTFEPKEYACLWIIV